MAIYQTHIRSISLPSRLQSTSTGFESDLQNLKSLQVSANSEAIQSGLIKISQLYSSVEEIAKSQQKSILLEEKSTEESLTASVELLDYCSDVKEVIQMMKESVQALQSAFRRKGADSSLQNDLALYFSCRKRMNKSIAKILRALKKSESVSVVINEDGNFSSVFRELKGVMTAILKSVLLFLSLPMATRGGWSLVSKKLMMITKCNEDVASEAGNVDLDLSYLLKMRSLDGDRVVDVQKRLHNLEVIVEGFEGGLETLFRQLVRIRVTLLNILTDY